MEPFNAIYCLLTLWAFYRFMYLSVPHRHKFKLWPECADTFVQIEECECGAIKIYDRKG